MQSDGVAALHKQHFTGVQLVAPSHGVFQRRRGVATLQPGAEHSRQTGIVQAQQIGQGFATGRQASAIRSHASGGRAEERQFGGRRVAGESAHHVQARDFKRRQTLAQRRLQGVFPTGFNMDAAPQTLQTVQTVLGEPRLELAVRFHLFLQGFEGFDFGGQIGQPGRLGIHRLLAAAPLFVQLRHLLLQLLQAATGHAGGVVGLRQLRTQVHKLLRVRRGQGVTVHGQAFAALVQLARLFFGIALVGGQNLNLLLHLAHAASLLVRLGLGLAQGLFQIGQGLGLVFHLRGQGDGLVFGHHRLLGQAFHFNLRIGHAGGPLRRLFSELHQALLGTLAAFDHKTNLGFQAPHFGAGFVQSTLRLVHLIACRVMRLANGFQVRLDMAQVGNARLQIVGGFFNVRLQTALARLGFAAFDEPQLVLFERAVGLERVEALRHLGLLFQFFQIGIELAQDVVDAGQVLARV